MRPHLCLAFQLVHRAAVLTRTPESRIWSSRRQRHLVRTRWAVYAALRQHGWFLQSIASVFCVHHTTILHGLQQAAILCRSGDATFTDLVRKLHATPPHLAAAPA